MCELNIMYFVRELNSIISRWFGVKYIFNKLKKFIIIYFFVFMKFVIELLKIKLSGDDRIKYIYNVIINIINIGNRIFRRWLCFI